MKWSCGCKDAPWQPAKGRGGGGGGGMGGRVVGVEGLKGVQVSGQCCGGWGFGSGDLFRGKTPPPQLQRSGQPGEDKTSPGCPLARTLQHQGLQAWKHSTRVSAQDSTFNTRFPLIMHVIR